jgi:hypothetical protein
MAGTDLPGEDYRITHLPPKTDPKHCEALCAADSKCKAWTYVIRGTPAGSGDCCLKTAVPCPGPSDLTFTMVQGSPLLPLNAAAALVWVSLVSAGPYHLRHMFN